MLRWMFVLILPVAGLAPACLPSMDDVDSAIHQSSLRLGTMRYHIEKPTSDGNGEMVEVGDPAAASANNYEIIHKIVSEMDHPHVRSAEIISVTKSVDESFDELVSLLQSDDIDLVLDSSFPTTRLSIAAGLEPAFVRYKHGSGFYASMILANKDTEFKALTDLKGRVVGFEERNSTSARWLPQSILMEQGFEMVSFEDCFDVTQEVPRSACPELTPNQMGYVFVGKASDMPDWLTRGWVDVAAMSTSDFDDLSPFSKENLHEVVKSDPVPQQILSFRANLHDSIKAAVRQAVENINPTVDNPSADDIDPALVRWEYTTQLEPMTEETLEGMQDIRQRYDLIKDEMDKG